MREMPLSKGLSSRILRAIGKVLLPPVPALTITSVVGSKGCMQLHLMSLRDLGATSNIPCQKPSSIGHSQVFIIQQTEISISILDCGKSFCTCIQTSSGVETQILLRHSDNIGGPCISRG